VLTISLATTNDTGNYTVRVSNTYGSTNSAPASLTVVRDTTIPTVGISTPGAGERTSAPVLSGTAADNVLVTHVSYWLTNQYTASSASGTATLTPASGASVNWSIATQLLPGTNVLTVQSRDFSGNLSAKVSRTFFFRFPAQLLLRKGGAGNGVFRYTSSVAGDTLPTNGAFLSLGEGYSITALADQNSLFSNWVIGARVSTNPVLQFLMQTNLVLTANFASNYFLAAAGNYNGLFATTNGVAEESAGLVYNLALRTNGVFTGKLYLAGTNYALSGSFDLRSHAELRVGSAAAPGGRSAAPGGPLVVELTLQRSPTNQITGTISNTLWVANLTAVRAGGAASAEYTMLFSPLSSLGSAPPGDGYALVTNQAGMLRFTGALADGSGIGPSVAVSADGAVPVYASLYGNTGLLLGWINLNQLDAAPPPNLLTWIKKPSGAGSLYPDGFTNSLALQGARWTTPRANTAGISLPAGNLSVSNAGLNLEFNVALVTNNTLTKLNGGPTNLLSGSVVPATGQLKVNFGNGNGSAVVQGIGAVLQGRNTGGGYFLTATNAGALLLAPQP
jgi:hypothetical protein